MRLDEVNITFAAAPLHDNRLRVYEDKRWEYDNFGNVTTKLTARHTQQQFRWNAEHQLAEAVTVRNGAEQRTTYGYDAFGRRSWKQDAFGVTTFVWDGNCLLSETRGGRSHLWIYEDDSFAPLAQISLRKGDTEHDAEVYWYHNDVSGMPRELTGAGGEIAWRAEYRAWGNTLRVSISQPAPASRCISRYATRDSISMPRRVCTITVSATMIRMRGALSARTR
nr:hypothetical protein [Cronobacter muytjensii]